MSANPACRGTLVVAVVAVTAMHAAKVEASESMKI